MTKLLACMDCGDIITPYHEELRTCKCTRHSCWWDNKIFVVYDKWRHECPDFLKSTCNYKPNHRIIGIHNGIFNIWNNGEGLYKDQIQKMLDDTPDYYLFKSWNSPIVIIEVGYTGDTRWADHVLDKDKIAQTLK